MPLSISLQERDAQRFPPIALNADFDVVGFDTSANTMIYAALTLAIHDDLQDRIINEIDHVYQELAREGKGTLDYQRDYLKVPNILAFVVSKLPAVRTP